MVSEVMRVLNATYGKKKVQPLTKVCDYYNDGLYKKIRRKAMSLNHYGFLKVNNKEGIKLDELEKKEKVFPRDLLNKNFKLFDIEKQKIINLKIINDEREDYRKGIINTSSPLVCCLINKKVNDVILVRSLDNRSSLVSEYKILEIS